MSDSALKKTNRWLGLFSMLPALAMSFLDQSVLPVALPSIQDDLNASNNALIWAVNAYLLTTAVLVLACGKLSDRIGLRRSFCTGIVLFGVASILCAISQSSGLLIAARALQGVGSAFMLPTSVALLMTLFPPRERGKATGLNVAFGSIFLILGPLIGGYLTENFSWRLIFWINVPLSILGMLMVLSFIPKSQKVPVKFDFKGSIYFLLSASLLVTILMQGREWGWLSLEMGVLYFFCFLFSYLFFLREKVSHPYLDLSLFKNELFKAVNVSIFSTQFVMMITIFWAIYFQDVLGWSPINAGFVIFLCCVPVVIIAPLGGYLLDKVGPKIPIGCGYILLIASLFWIAFTIGSSLPLLLPGLIAFGVGISLILTPSYATAMNAVPPSKSGIAFGTIQMIRSLASALGVATIGSFFDNYAGESGLFYAQIGLAFFLIAAFCLVFRYYTSHSSKNLSR